MNELIIARINNVDVVSTVKDGEILVPIKPICTAIGIAFERQYTKLRDDETFKSVITLTVTTGADGKQYEMVCLPLMYVYLWLGSINPKNVSDEARPAVSRYRVECAEALYAYLREPLNESRNRTNKKFVCLKNSTAFQKICNEPRARFDKRKMHFLN